MALELVAGAVIAERFRLQRQLGRGGMGSVWLAHHVGLDVPCALKFIHAHAASSPDVRARFEREARAAAQLRSPNVVQILDYGVWDGSPYIAMEFLEGEDLSQRLKRRVWSLAVVVFQCITGQLPFHSDALGDLMMKIMVAPIPMPSQLAPVPPALDARWSQAVARDPAARFQSAKELAESLAAAVGLKSQWADAGGSEAASRPPTQAAPAAAGQGAFPGTMHPQAVAAQTRHPQAFPGMTAHPQAVPAGGPAQGAPGAAAAPPFAAQPGYGSYPQSAAMTGRAPSQATPLGYGGTVAMAPGHGGAPAPYPVEAASMGGVPMYSSGPMPYAAPGGPAAQPRSSSVPIVLGIGAVLVRLYLRRGRSRRRMRCRKALRWNGNVHEHDPGADQGARRALSRGPALRRRVSHAARAGRLEDVEDVSRGAGRRGDRPAIERRTTTIAR